MAKAKVFGSVEEIKSFLLWARENGIQRAKVGDIEIEFSNLAMLAQYQDKEAVTASLDALLQKSEQQIKKEEDELLFHSAL